jgi:hypothetical protein
MTRLIAFFIFGFIIVILSSCEKDINTNQGNPNITNHVLFQYEYINYAWGYQHSGWLIDSSGNVYCYNRPSLWNYCDSSGYISDTNMESNILHTDSICYKIEKKELAAKTMLIENASKGEVTKPIPVMADAGIAIFTGFTQNIQTKQYKRIVFKQIGDYYIKNKSVEALELYNWLDSLNKKIIEPKNLPD